MDLELNQAQREALEAADAAAIGLLAPDAAANDRNETFPKTNLIALGARGLMGVNIDPVHGGRGAGVVAYAVAVRRLAAACPGTTVGMMVTNMVAEAIQSYGSDAQKAHYLPKICGGEWPTASFSLSEPGAGSDAASLRTTAVLDGDHYVLNGTKSWVTSGGFSGVYLVMAKTDVEAGARGISAFLVDSDTPGLTVPRPEDKMGMRASATTELVFEDCRVPVANRLGAEGIGFRIAMGSLDGGRVGVSAQACGIATAALKATRNVLAERHAVDEGLDGDQIASLALCERELAAAWLLCLRAASLKERGKNITREAAMSKLMCTETASRICDRALALCGRPGYAGLGEIERRARDARVTRIYEGTSEVQRIVIAREVLKQL